MKQLILAIFFYTSTISLIWGADNISGGCSTVDPDEYFITKTHLDFDDIRGRIKKPLTVNFLRILKNRYQEFINTAKLFESEYNDYESIITSLKDLIEAINYAILIAENTKIDENGKRIITCMQIERDEQDDKLRADPMWSKGAASAITDYGRAITFTQYTRELFLEIDLEDFEKSLLEDAKLIFNPANEVRLLTLVNNKLTKLFDPILKKCITKKLADLIRKKWQDYTDSNYPFPRLL